MDKPSKLRWAVLLSALAATLGAIFYPVDEPTASQMLSIPKPVPALRPVSLTEPKDQPRPIWIASDENPFAPRTWEPPPPPPETARTVQPVELTQAAPAAEAPPPPLPYRFLGQMQDGGDRIFYLGHGDQVLLARQGETLEGSYKVVAVSDGMIEFESVPSGVRQTLPIPAQ